MGMKKLVIVGAGGFGREVMWQLTKESVQGKYYDILGYVDDDYKLEGKIIDNYPVIGNIEWLKNYPDEIAAVICIGNSCIRKNIYERIVENSKIEFPSIITEDVKYSDTVTFGKGCIICLSNILTVNIKLGDFVISNLDCTIGHDVVIDDFVTLYPSVNVSGNVHIGMCSEIGTGSNIIQGKDIGKNVIVGAGSVVVKDIPEFCTAVGTPARPIKFHKK